VAGAVHASEEVSIAATGVDHPLVERVSHVVEEAGA
jgi:hypothetical protein